MFLIYRQIYSEFLSLLELKCFVHIFERGIGSCKCIKEL